MDSATSEFIRAFSRRRNMLEHQSLTLPEADPAADELRIIKNVGMVMRANMDLELAAQALVQRLVDGGDRGLAVEVRAVVSDAVRAHEEDSQLGERLGMLVAKLQLPPQEKWYGPKTVEEWGVIFGCGRNAAGKHLAELERMNPPMARGSQQRREVSSRALNDEQIARLESDLHPTRTNSH